jgi:hypothetical protein
LRGEGGDRCARRTRERRARAASTLGTHLRTPLRPSAAMATRCSWRGGGDRALPRLRSIRAAWTLPDGGCQPHPPPLGVDRASDRI